MKQITYNLSGGEPLEISEQELADFVAHMKKVEQQARENAAKAAISASKIIVR